MIGLSTVDLEQVTTGTGPGRQTGRVRTPVVDQHATWIAVNPVQGCPKACQYCFLHERGQTAVRPEHLATPEQTIELLRRSPYYDPARPVAFYTWTDVMALPASRAHLHELLDVAARAELANPIVVITKCHIPDSSISAISQARTLGLRVLVYLSYSGMDRRIEPGIRHDALVDNFPRLAEAGVPIVHYWRPSLPRYATAEAMRGVLDWVSRYAECTVAAGLKVEPAALERLTRMWPELAQVDGVTDVEGVYPRAFWEFIHRCWRTHPGHPLFHTNACALAYVLGRPDAFGVFGSTVCRTRNVCPVAQRGRCHRAHHDRRLPGREGIADALARRGALDATFTLDAAEGVLTIHAPLSTAAVAALTQDLNLRIRITRDATDPYWNSGTAGATPLILG